MRAIKQLAMFGFFVASIGACFDAPEFPVEPQIEFEDMVYKRVDGVDSLIFLIKFTDGDGDLGLAESEIGCSISGENNLICFQNTVHELYQNTETGDYGVIDTGEPCNGSSSCYASKFIMLKPDRTPISYADKRNDPTYSSLPAFTKPFSCVNWEVEKDEDEIVTDTVFIERNPDYNNFEIDFLVKNPNGTFTEFDFTKEYDYPNCGDSFDGRFPILFSNEPGSPLEGVIRFRIGSPFLRTQFSLKTLKFRIQIKDRALNKSNEIFTPEISF